MPIPVDPSLLWADESPGRPAASDDQRIREMSDRLHLALDSARMGTWDWHIPSGMLHASARAAQLHGLTPEPFHDRFETFFARLPASARDAMRQAWRAVRDDRFLLTYRSASDQSAPRLLEARAVLYRDERGAPLRLGGTLLDITPRQTQAALEASEEKFAKAFHSSPDSITITELESGRYLEVNDGFYRLTGFTAQEVLGRTAYDIGIWSDRDQRLRMIEQLQRNGAVHHREMIGRDKRGAPLILDVSVESITLDNTVCLLMIARDIGQLKRAQAQIQHLAYHDALTNLPNRALLMDRLGQQLSLLSHHDLRGALLFMDLDHFKHINDSLGHPLGDSVLKVVTARLEASVRLEDTVARLGGDEFVVLICGLEGSRDEVEEQVREQSDALRQLLAEPMFLDGHRLQVTPSIGVALIPDHGSTPADLLKRADIALYRAKDTGRNTTQFYHASMQQAVSERLRMENDLRLALARNELRLHYQAQVDARGNHINGAEALLRWQHPQHGLLSPRHFVQILEESGMILDVGAWALDEACRVAGQWLERGLIQADGFLMGVNISPRQFRQSDFVERIERSLTQHRLPASMLKLEITEGIVIRNLEDTITRMHRLQRLGVGFAMDDFGTGYSSLTYLKRLPIDTLKIDQSFIHDAATDPNDAEIIRTIVAMAQSLNLNAIAEGVETVEQLAFLQGLGCHCYQGYLFSRPLAETDFETLLRDTGPPLDERYGAGS